MESNHIFNSKLEAERPCLLTVGANESLPCVDSLEDSFCLEGFNQATYGQKQPNPYYYHFIKLDWAVFGSLSWKNEYMHRYCYDSAQLSKRDCYSMIRNACDALGLRRKNLGIYFKPECSTGQISNAHFIIANHALKSVAPGMLADTLQSVWRDQFKLGTCKIEPFDVTRKEQGLSYITKSEFDLRGVPIEPYDHLSKTLTRLIRSRSFHDTKCHWQSRPFIRFCAG